MESARASAAGEAPRSSSSSSRGARLLLARRAAQVAPLGDGALGKERVQRESYAEYLTRLVDNGHLFPEPGAKEDAPGLGNPGHLPAHVADIWPSASAEPRMPGAHG